MMRATVAGLAAGISILVLASGALAGLADDPNGMTGWQDLQEYRSESPATELAVDVEFCVYAPGAFNLSYPGMDPSGGSDYVYAYQLFNNVDPHPHPIAEERDYVMSFSVGLTGGDEEGAGIGVVDVGGFPPAVWWFPTNTARWQYTSGGGFLDCGLVSDVLMYTSPYGPELDTATVFGYRTVTHLLPSPVPEPTSLALMGAGAAASWFVRRRRVSG